MENDTKENKVLSEEFDGVFRFTNWTDEDFTAKWNSVAYTFPSQKTSPMIVPNETPEGVQNIRMKFARELAEREFYKSDKFKAMNDSKHGQNPATYTESELAPFTQRCLEALPIAPAKAKIVKEVHEEVFTKDEDGQPRTRVLRSKQGNSGSDESLVGSGAVIA